MVRPKAAFRRSDPRFQPQPTVLVICEDSKSSKTYLNDVKMHFRAQLRLQVTYCGKTDPVGIVSEAIRESKRFDRVFCVIDRDEHPNFDEALRLVTKKPKVTVIPSHPCFEYWLLLHFRYTRKPYRRTGSKSPADRLVEDLRRHPKMENYAKGDGSSPFKCLSLGQFADARRHAARALAHALEVRELNPSTRLHELIDVIEQLGSPVPIGKEIK